MSTSKSKRHTSVAERKKSAVRAPESKRRRRRAGPGRPEGISRVRDEILDAGEVEFANLGYAGTSLRNVAERARVTQALINYYFGSKYGLFECVFLRRARKIVDERMRLLDELRRSNRPIQVRDVVKAFLSPALSMRETAGGRIFMRIQARLHTEPPEISYKLRNEAYDESTRIFTEALHELLPHLSKRDVYWRMTFVVGGYLYAFSDTHRLDIMAPGICNPDDMDEVLVAITTFMTAGMLASSPRRSPRERKNGTQ